MKFICWRLRLTAFVLWFCILPSLPSTSALLEERFVTFSSSPNFLPIHDTVILHDGDDFAGIQIAAHSLIEDFEQITGKKPDNVTWRGGLDSLENGSTAIIIGSISSDLIQAVAENTNIKLDDIEGKWETFKTSVVSEPLPGVQQALVIVGSDMRGTAFGVYTLAEQCGQSPFHFWADVPAAKHDSIYALPKTTIHGEPTVRYRGLFINDEAPALTGWWSKYNNKEHQVLDSNFYRHVFDMMARLKTNFIWPGSWKAFVPEPGNIFFTDDPENIALANDYGIVVSTSHHEPMQRATNEWNETEVGPWDWLENRDNVTEFMEEGVRRAGLNDTYFTLGMRSDADGPIEGDNPLEILKDVFETQREMLAREYGNETAAKQVWTIYKEVAIYYAAGLRPPEDVTLMFTDDNWGNILRLPLDNETDWAGGIGLYYHLQYTGGPKAYKWQNTNNLAKIYKELYHALERNATQIWVMNVADIKPLEMPFSFTMDLAWDKSHFDFDTIPDYVKAFVSREFAGAEFDDDQIDEITDIMLEHSRLLGRRKYEATQSQTYSILNFRENERVQAEWKSLADRVAHIRSSLPDDHSYQSAIFHYLGYQIQAGQLFMSIVLNQGLNNQWGRERRNDANALASHVLNEFDADFDMIMEYDALKDGKWAGIAAQPKHDQYGTPQSIGDEWWEPTTDAVSGLWYVQLRQNATSTFGNLGVYVQGSTSAQMQGRSLPSAARGSPTSGRESPVMPVLSPYSPATQFIDVYGRGDSRIPIEWSIEPPESWVLLNGSKGSILGRISETTPQQRLEVTIDWDSVPADFNETLDMRIDFDTLPRFDLIRVPILNMRAPDDFVGFPADGGLISIEAPHYQRLSNDGEDTSDADSVKYTVLPYLGSRSNSGSLALRPYRAARADEDTARDTWVEYDIYLFAEEAELNATIYVTSGLDTDPTMPMEWSLLLDGEAQNGTEWSRMLDDPDDPGDTPPGWYDTVADQVWIRNATFGTVSGGEHTLRWRTNNPEVYLEKIVLYHGIEMPTSYLGAPETVKLGGDDG